MLPELATESVLTPTHISDNDILDNLTKKYVYSEKNVEALIVAFNTKSNIIFFGPGE